MRYNSMTLIQSYVRRKIAYNRFRRRTAEKKRYMGGLPSVLQVRRLGDRGNAYRIGRLSKYGFCNKHNCSCPKFKAADPMKPLICECGHFVTNHVIGYYRDGRFGQEDYYNPGNPRIVMAKQSFNAVSGPTMNYDWLPEMKPKYLRRSLAARQASPPHPESLTPDGIKQTIRDFHKRPESRRLKGKRVHIDDKKKILRLKQRQRKVQEEKRTETQKKRQPQLLKDQEEEVDQPAPPSSLSGMFSAPGKTTKKAQREPSGVQGLIDNLEKEIEHTRSKLKRIRRTTAKLEFEEKVLRKSSSASAKLVERSLLHSRVVERLQIMYDEEDTFRSSHEVILDDHKAKIEAQKAELSEKLDKMYAASLEKLKSSAQDGAPLLLFSSIVFST